MAIFPIVPAAIDDKNGFYTALEHMDARA